MRRSVGLLRKTWGEGITGNFAIHVVSWGVGLVGILLAISGFALAAYLQSIVIAVATGALVVIGFVLLAIVTSALRQVFLAGLYQYAITGHVPQGFSEASMQQALQRPQKS